MSLPLPAPFGVGRYLMTLVVAMSLNIAPWSGVMAPFTPDWVLLVLIYWTLAVPERVGIGHAWLIGLYSDVLTGRMLGQHALPYILISYVCLKLHKRLRQFPILQQGFFIFLCLLLAKLLLFWIESSQTRVPLDYRYWLSAVTGTLVWPLVYSTLRAIRLLRR
ncbi:MAG: rod shape-determining protein MreD [Methylococcales bacterium]|nr:rod shape-determining protein MreD [Methylococcales bacterium]